MDARPNKKVEGNRSLLARLPGRLHQVNGPQRFDLACDIHRVGTLGGAGGAGVAHVEARALWHFRQREPGMVRFIVLEDVHVTAHQSWNIDPVGAGGYDIRRTAGRTPGWL